LPRKHKLGVGHRDPSPSKRKNISPLPVDELTRAIDLRTDGCQIRHGLTFRNRCMARLEQK
jgi:hypothetical protein